jgi:prepilin-type N-terminal cleavage/methylation domain-containing protein
MKIFKKRGAFTLIELIAVVSIIGILMTFILPASQKVLLNARKSKAQAYMKQIAGAYCRFYQEKGYIPNAGSSVELAEKFASEGELNNANLFVFPGDSKAAGLLKENIWPKNDVSAWEPGKQLSVSLIGNITKEVNPSTTPIAFSRGLVGSTWTKDGIWGVDGGFVAFLDGQVRWYTNLTGKLSVESSSKDTIPETLSVSGGTILHTDT